MVNENSQYSIDFESNTDNLLNEKSNILIKNCSDINERYLWLIIVINLSVTNNTIVADYFGVSTTRIPSTSVAIDCNPRHELPMYIFITTEIGIE